MITSTRVDAWIDGGWLSVRPDSDLLASKLSPEPLNAHVQSWMDAVVAPFRPVLRAYEALRDELLDISPSGVLPTPDYRDQDISVHGDQIKVLIGDPDYDGHAAALFSPDEARALAERLMTAADEAERNE